MPEVLDQPEVSTDAKMQDALMSSWLNDEPTKVELAPQNNQAEPPNGVPSEPTPPPAPEPKPEISYLKEKFGWDSEEVALKEVQELREKAKPFEYKNEKSKRVAEYINEGKTEELYQFLDYEKRVAKLSTVDLNVDKSAAAELVKFGIRNDNKESKLSEDEVEFLFNEKYATPSKPVQGEMEEDADYAQKVAAWETQVANAEKRLLIEAKINQPKLAQLKSELVLPEIKREAPLNQPSQEDLAKAENFKKAYLQSVDSSVNNLNSLSWKVIDKDVEIPLQYDLSAKEKAEVSQRMKDFSENGYNATAILADLWATPEGTINTDAMSKDLTYLLFKDTINQKLINDAAAKRLDIFITNKRNPNVNVTNTNGTFQPKAPQTKEEAIVDAWLTV